MSEECKYEENLVIKYISENYSALGSSESVDYITSGDIVRELSEMITVSISTVSGLMAAAKFETVFLDGKPYWKVFLKG